MTDDPTIGQPDTPQTRIDRLSIAREYAKLAAIEKGIAPADLVVPDDLAEGWAVLIIKGKRKGDTVKLHQWANDWMTADADDGKPLVLKPTMVELDASEAQVMQDSYAAFLAGDRRTGFFWREWELLSDGRFARRQAEGWAILGYSHAASGLVAGLGAGILLHYSLPRDAALAGFTAGMALLPDLDSVGACASRSLGILSEGLACVVRFASFGHRHGTHSVPGVAVFTSLAVLACAFRRDYAGMAGLALLVTIAVAGALEALHLTRGHTGDLIGAGVSALVIWQGYGLSLIPLAVLLGTITHLSGDSCTDSGVMWLWPASGHRFHFLPGPLQFTTGKRAEKWIVDPALLIALGLLAWIAAGLPFRGA